MSNVLAWFSSLLLLISGPAGAEDIVKRDVTKDVTFKVEVVAGGLLPDQVCLVECGEGNADYYDCQDVVSRGTFTFIVSSESLCYQAVTVSGVQPDILISETSQDSITIIQDQPASVIPPPPPSRPNLFE